ncbi:MAG: DUF4276 family protein [Flavipsychrobacter sp.]|nr:DUF4276 family protein [Flavipsychrobacter sp.]
MSEIMIYILGEGHGEELAASKLINKMWANLGLPHQPVAKTIRWKNLHTDVGLNKGIEHIRAKGNAQGLIIMRDDEDSCPARLAPEKSRFIDTLNFDFPISYNIMYREFETIFVAYFDHFRGRAIPHSIRGEIKFRENIEKPANPETIRDAKGAVSNAFIGNSSYKPTTDQLSLTQAIDIDLLRGTGLPCFESLERGLLHISENIGRRSVYPYNR